MKKFLTALLIILLFSPAARGEVKGEVVEYQAGGKKMVGYIAYDKKFSGKRPGILIVHEWWGHNEYVRKRARMLAREGYVALALDMYGEGKQASHPKDAGRFAREVRENFPLMKERFEAALSILKEHPLVDPGRVGAIGYCFGGSVVLSMALHGADLRGVASFHGSLSVTPPPESVRVKAKILVLHGGSDVLVPKEQVERFRKMVQDAGADLTFVEYPGAKHSFTNPDADAYAEKFGIPVGYDPDADRKSWEEMKRFFSRVFGNL